MLFVVASLPEQRGSWDTRGRLDDEERKGSKSRWIGVEWGVFRQKQTCRCCLLGAGEREY